MLKFYDIADYSVFDERSKNWKLRSIFNFLFFSLKLKIICTGGNKSTSVGDGDAWIKVHKSGASLPLPTGHCGMSQPSTSSAGTSPLSRCRHLESEDGRVWDWIKKEAGNSFERVNITNMDDSSVEYINDLV